MEKRIKLSVLARLLQNIVVLRAFVDFDEIWPLGGHVPNRLKIIEKAGKAWKTQLFL